MSALTPTGRARPLTGSAADLLANELAAAIERGPHPDATPSVAADVRPFALGAESSRPPQKLTGLERMGEKVARTLRAAIEPLVNTRTQIAAAPLMIRRFDDWASELPLFVSLSHYKLRPLAGGMLIAIQPDFIAGLIERFYGGTPKTPAPTRRAEFTASEELLLARLLDKVVGILVEHWREVTPVDAQLVAREAGMAHIAFCRPDDAVVIQPFMIKPADGAAHTIAIVYPLAMLRPIENRMATRIQDDAPSGAAEWRRALSEALEQVELPVRSVLARPEISLAGLMGLKPGDVIPIQLSPRTPLLVAARQIAEGTIGEQDGRAALMIERVGVS